MESLPEECISTILSLTSPRDACCMALMTKTFRSAANSDTVWLNFLPSDYRDIISRSARSEYFNSIVAKKKLYLELCVPVLIDSGEKSFCLDKWSGKKCYMIASRNLYIAGSDDPAGYWQWPSLPQSRFAQVAQLQEICWFEVAGDINIRMLSPATNYAAYLVYKLTPRAHGFTGLRMEVAAAVAGDERTRTPYLEPIGQPSGEEMNVHPNAPMYWPLRRGSSFMCGPQTYPPSSIGDRSYAERRNDGWLEIELGEFFNEGGQDLNMHMSIEEVKVGHWKSGLFIEGIEIRPKA